MSHAIAVAIPEKVGELAVPTRDGEAKPSRLLRSLWRAAQRICIAAVVMLGAMAAANAACDQTTDSTSGVTINFTSVGQIYRLCLTVGAAAADDSVVYGVYSVAGTDAFYNAPIANSSGHSGSPLLTAADYSPTTSKATYTFHPTNPNQNGQSAKAGQAEIDITLNSKTGGGQDSITLYYTPGCSDFNVGCSGSSIANTPYTFTINLPSPTVTSISPTTGPLAGGTSVVITGTNFTGTTGAAGVKRAGPANSDSSLS
ncbi:IPT/TIG domain-containing protein, partial [Bradyrhizobium japonicum]